MTTSQMWASLVSTERLGRDVTLRIVDHFSIKPRMRARDDLALLVPRPVATLFSVEEFEVRTMRIASSNPGYSRN